MLIRAIEYKRKICVNMDENTIKTIERERERYEKCLSKKFIEEKNRRMYNTTLMTFFSFVLPYIFFKQDYLGGIIVFVSIVTALFTSQMYPESASPSLVALAINYTLLVPIYLNWVVQLLASLEMYIGAVERISHYINPTDKTSSDNDTDESPCELMAIKPLEKCEYIYIIR